MSVILVCRTCSTPLGDDPQERATGFCSGKCAKALAVTNPRCEKRFLGIDARAVCVLNAGHSGLHQAAHGFTIATDPLRKVLESVENAIETHNELIKKVDSDIANEMLGRSVPSPMRKTCACCPNPVNTSNPHAVFCSSCCAEKAAKTFRSTPRTMDFALNVQEASEKVTTAADRMLRFMCGLNLQDHSVKEQREALEIIHAMKTALKPERMKSEAFLKRLRDEEAWQKSVRAEKVKAAR